MVQSLVEGWAPGAINRPTPGNASKRYLHVARAGADVDVYAVDHDFSIQEEHFEGRWCFDLTPPEAHSKLSDEASHGMMIASVIGSTSYGIAKEPNIFPVCTRHNNRGLVGALEAVIAHASQRRKLPGYKGSVVNISLSKFGRWQTPELVAVLQKVGDAGICVVGSAGNDGRVLSAAETQSYVDMGMILVGSIKKSFQPRSGSNSGPGVLIFAPGIDVACTDQYGQLTSAGGTSLAAAIVTGIMATFYGVEGTKMTPQRAKQLLILNAEYHTYTDRGGVKWRVRLANNGFIHGADSVHAPYDGYNVSDLGQDPQIIKEAQWPGLAPWVPQMDQ